MVPVSATQYPIPIDTPDVIPVEQPITAPAYFLCKSSNGTIIDDGGNMYEFPGFIPAPQSIFGTHVEQAIPLLIPVRESAQHSMFNPTNASHIQSDSSPRIP